MPPESAAVRRPVYRYYVLACLTALYMVSHLDRGLMILLMQPIKQDLRLTDTQLGLVTGISFAVFYATLGIPAARWSDCGNRVDIASLAVGFWGVTVMAYVAIGNFAQLAIGRAAAAIGEAGGKPPSYSLIGDYFPKPAERTRAMAVYLSASSITALVSFSLGGWLAEQVGWRMTFLIMGVPGLLLAILVKLTVIEPRARPAKPAVQDQPGISAPRARLGDVIKLIVRQPSLCRLSIAIILMFVMSQGLGPWYAAYLMRAHEIGSAELGLWLALIFGLGAIAGLSAGAFLAGRWFTDERVQLRITALTLVLVLPLVALFVFAPGKELALFALAAMTITLSSFLPPVYALLQRLAPDDMRATILSVVMLFANLIGMGLGPLAVGGISDWLQPSFGLDGLRYGLVVLANAALLSGLFFWRASQTVHIDLATRAAADSAIAQ